MVDSPQDQPKSVRLDFGSVADPVDPNAPLLSLEELGRKTQAPAEIGSADSEKNFLVAITIYGGMFLTGLHLFGESPPFSQAWLYGAAYMLVGGSGAVSVTPLFRDKFPSVIRTMGAPKSLWAAAAATWVLLGLNLAFDVYDHFVSPKPPVAVNAPPPEQWPALTEKQASEFASRVRFIPPEDIVVACETRNCKDLADGIAEILQKTPRWHVEILHRGGLDITGVSGIRLNPNEPATEALRDVLESTVGLTVKVGPNSRKDLGTDTRTFLVVGTRPF